MFRAFRVPISWRELLTRTWREINDDNCLGLAAQLAYYFILALFPALIVVVAIASFFPRSTLQQVLSDAGAVHAARRALADPDAARCHPGGRAGRPAHRRRARRAVEQFGRAHGDHRHA